MDGVEVVRREPFGDNPAVGERGASTQRSILSAALAVFGQHGFHGTRVELITEASGCSRPAFYQYFSSKDDVFWSLAGHLGRELGSLAERLGQPTADADGIDELEAWIGPLVDLYQAYQPVFVSFREAVREDEPPKPVPRTLAAAFHELLERADPDPGAGVEALAEAISATILRAVHYWLIGVERTSRARFTRGLAMTVHRLIFGYQPTVNAGALHGRPPKRKPVLPAGESIDDAKMRPRGRATRRLLLDAATRVLPSRGYHETRVDDIVYEAGFSHGSFYRYFENKDEIFSVLALEAVEHMVGLAERFPDPPYSTLGEWLNDWFESYRAKGGVISVWEEIGFEAPAVVARSAELNAVFVDRLERIVHGRGFGDTEVDALTLLAALEHGPHGVLSLKTPDEDRVIDAVGHIIRRGVLGGD